MHLRNFNPELVAGAKNIHKQFTNNSYFYELLFIEIIQVDLSLRLKLPNTETFVKVQKELSSISDSGSTTKTSLFCSLHVAQKRLLLERKEEKLGFLFIFILTSKTIFSMVNLSKIRRKKVLLFS